MKQFLAIVIVVAIFVVAASIWFRSPKSEEGGPVQKTLNRDVYDHFVLSPNAPKRSGPAAIYPDLMRNPGAINPDINQDNIGDTICNPNWSTKSIRPPTSYTGKLKRQQIQDSGLADTEPRDYEEDHIIPLELGGHPSDPNNLWPEPYDPKPGARQKDRVENQLHREVCVGDISLERAQSIIVQDWYACYVNIENRELCK